MAGRVTIAQMSDLHVGRRGLGRDVRAGTDAAVQHCIARVNESGADAVVITGDLTHRGSLAQYVRLREMLAALKAPYFLLPGNHDDPTALRAAFADQRTLFATSPYIAYTADIDFVRLIAVDSTRGGKIGGYLDDARLHWLEAQLAGAEGRPTLLALHHPPFYTGVIPMDAFAFDNVYALGRLIARNTHVRRIICGHVHCARAVEWNGTVSCTSPTPSPQLLLRTMPRRFLRLGVEAPGFLLHSFAADASVTTRVARINGHSIRPVELAVQ